MVWTVGGAVEDVVGRDMQQRNSSFCGCKSQISRTLSVVPIGREGVGLGSVDVVVRCRIEYQVGVKARTASRA